MPTFQRGDLRLAWTEHGDASGPPLVLLHGLLLSSAGQERVARALRRPRVLLLDLHGHGDSSQPADPARYTWAELVADVVALLDHLDIPRAAVGGISLGANVALAAAERVPDRLTHLILEMPVLARGSVVGKPLFTAVAAAYRAARPVASPLTYVLRRTRIRPPAPELRMLHDLASHRPASAEAVLRGLLADELPGREEAVEGLDLPALVVGHRGDPLHPIADARWLAARLPRSTLVEVPSILTHRVRYTDLAERIDDFLSV